MPSLLLHQNSSVYIIPMLNVFLHEIVIPLDIMKSEIKCFSMVEELLSLLSVGADSALPHVQRIRKLIYEHGVLFKQLYPDQIRPKFHHLYHIPENIVFLQKLISCFVLERKHISTKDAVRHVYRFVDHAVIMNIVNRLCTAASSDDDLLFCKQYLIDPVPHVLTVGNFLSSATARLPCGTVFANDLVFLTDRSVGYIKHFFSSHDGTFLAQIEVLTKVTPELWQTVVASIVFASTDDIVSAVMWCRHSANHIRVVVPVLYR